MSPFLNKGLLSLSLLLLLLLYYYYCYYLFFSIFSIFAYLRELFSDCVLFPKVLFS